MKQSPPSLLYLTIVVLFFVMALLFLHIRNQDNTTVYAPILVRPKVAVAPVPQHVPKPKIVKGLYLTASSAGHRQYRQNLLRRLKNSRLNTVVIDIKDYSGYILYQSKLNVLQKEKAIKNQLGDVQQVIDALHRQNIYLIARQTVFQDPVLAATHPELALHDKTGAVWLDRKGLAWLDPSQEDVWQYNLAIAQEASRLGFDEINFDYIRYPSDGDMASLDYNIPSGQKMTDVMKNFFAFLDKNLSDLATTSIDMFGLVMDNTASGYDLGIGQKLTDTADYFDYVCPMMYASHYAQNYLDFANAAEHPGEVVAHGLDISRDAMKNKRAQIRPWLQAFSLGAVYDQPMIDQQIQAVENVTSTDGWLLWNARNYYPDYIF